MAKTLSVTGISEGTVIDHIPAGNALKIIQLLRLENDQLRMAIGLNLPSVSLGFKDLIKIENRILSQKEVNDIAVFAPQATINLIKNYQIVEKLKTALPETIDNILICPNPRCITHREKLGTRFKVEKHKTHVVLHCHYCERMFHRDEIEDYCT